MSIDPTFKKPFSPPSSTPQNDGDKLARLVNWTLDIRPASDSPPPQLDTLRLRLLVQKYGNKKEG